MTERRMTARQEGQARILAGVIAVLAQPLTAPIEGVGGSREDHWRMVANILGAVVNEARRHAGMAVIERAFATAAATGDRKFVTEFGRSYSRKIAEHGLPNLMVISP
jgi:hypothetical protein